MQTEVTLDSLRRQFRTLRLLYAANLILAGAALILYFVDKRLSLAAIGAGFLFHVFCVRSKIKGYARDFVHLGVMLTLQKHMEQVSHGPRSVLTQDEIRTARLIPTNSGNGAILCREGGSGRWNGRTVRLGDVTLAHTFPLEGKNHHEFVVGCWAVVELHSDTKLDCRFLGCHSIMRPSLERFLQEQPDLTRVPDRLDKDWVILCPSGNTQLPGPRYFDKLKRLGRETDGQIAVCIHANRLHILFVNQILGQKVSQRVGPSPDFEKVDLLPQLSLGLALADELDKPE